MKSLKPFLPYLYLFTPWLFFVAFATFGASSPILCGSLCLVPVGVIAAWLAFARSAGKGED